MARSSGDQALARAERALREGDEDHALEALVEEWRATKDPALAELVERLSARLEGLVPPLEGNLATFHPAWLAVAKRARAVDLPRLLGSVLETTNRFGTAVVDALVERGEILARWPADPRSTAIVVAHLRRGGYESTSRSTQPFWASLFALLRKHDDPRARELLRPIRFARVFRTFSDGKRRIDWFQREADAVVADLERSAPSSVAPVPRDRAKQISALAKLLASLPKVGPRPAVRERIAERPDVPRAPAPKAPRPAKAERGSVAAHLAAAARASDDTARLDALLSAWRVARAPVIADLVEDVSRRLDAMRPPIRGKNRAAIQAEWLATAKKKDPTELPRLLDAITCTMGRSTDARARLEALGWLKPDPRVGPCVVGQLEVPAFHSSSSLPFWSALVRLAVEQGDPRTADLFEALAGRFDAILATEYFDRREVASWFRRQLTTAAATLRTVPPAVLGDDDRGAALALREKLGGVEATLLQRIAAHPADDEVRHVYADRLQERGDPRGEFIALQLADRDPARAEAIAEDHRHSWVGPLHRFLALRACRFERGFLGHAALFGVEPQRLQPYVDHPVWATVRTIHFGDIRARSFARSAAMRSLERVTVETATGPRALRFTGP